MTVKGGARLKNNALRLHPITLSPCHPLTVSSLHKHKTMNGHIIVDNHQDEALLTHTMRFAGLKISAFHSLAEAQADWHDSPADMVLICLRLADQVGLVRETRCGLIAPLILIVDAVDEDTHVAMIEAGADWVIQRPYSQRLLIAYTKALVEAIKRDSPQYAGTAPAQTDPPQSGQPFGDGRK